MAEEGDTIRPSQHNPPLEDIASALTGRMLKNGATPMTGPLKHSSGTALAPAITFNADIDTGLFLTAGGIGVAVGGVKVAEFVAGGLIGTRFIGEIIPLSFKQTTPPLCIKPIGQTLSRTTYAELWAVAQVEIVNGSSFWNNGNGSTTFGVMDLSGRGLFARDNMSGTPTGRIAGATNIGLTGGAESRTLLTANLPAYTPSGTVSWSQTSGTVNAARNGLAGPIQVTGSNSLINTGDLEVTVTGTSVFTGAAQGGTSTPFATLPPYAIVEYAIFAGV